jgi:hypothetical protein
VYGSDTWPMKAEDMQRLERTERMMVRWMCGVSLKNRISSKDLRVRLGIEGIDEIVERGRLRWFGHVERRPTEWVSACRRFEVVGTKGRGRSRKTWEECVKKDLNSRSLTAEMAQDREKWRDLIGRKRPTRASMEKPQCR